MSTSKPDASHSNSVANDQTNFLMNGVAGRSDDSYSQPSSSRVTCLLCSFAHIDSSVVEEHMNTVHFDFSNPSTRPDSQQKPEFACSICPESFNDMEALQIHTNERHKNSSYSQPSTSSVACLMCPFTHTDSRAVEEHMNSVHFELADPSGGSNLQQEPDFNCPMCPEVFLDEKSLRTHVNRRHKDILSPIKKPEPVNMCPVCNKFSSESSNELSEHVNSHFMNQNADDKPNTAFDGLIAEQISNATKEKSNGQEDKELELLKAQYGMNDKGNFIKQSINSMQRAVRSGRLTISDYYARENQLKSAEYRGVDDGSSCVRDVIPRIHNKSRTSNAVAETYMCSYADFYAGSSGDKGWGCGYRNIQMLLSALYRNKIYATLISKHFALKSNIANSTRNSMPSISKIQEMIEWAWEQGFDVKGCEQLEGKVCNTKKWIGATEVVALLSSMKIKCELIDTLRPTVAKLHYRMFDWIVSYFKKDDIFKPPLYLQHDGHSRTVVGVEILSDKDVTLLILDPGFEKFKIDNMLTSSNQFSSLKFVRKTLTAMSHNKQYQIVRVCGVMNSEEEYEASKVLQSTRIQ